MKTLLQRVCWNIRDWKRPDGAAKRDGGYSEKNGFGHEEWSFQTEDAYNGHVFGYLRYHPSKKTLTASGGHFKIAFWTRHPDSGRRFIVGYYHDAVLATKSDFAALDGHFEKHGIYNRRANELAVVPHFTPQKARKEIVSSVQNGVFNFKCKIDAVELLHNRIPLPAKVNGHPVGQYFTTPTIINGPLFRSKRQPKNSKSREAARPGFKGWRSGISEPLIEDSYFRESPATLRLIVPRHKKLANLFSVWLSKAGYKKIKKEVQFVDIEFFDGSNLCRAELKTCYGATTTKAIREALGQLLEYNFFGDRPQAKQWLIVLDEKPSKDDFAFLKKVAGMGLPISIHWLAGAVFQSRTFAKQNIKATSAR